VNSLAIAGISIFCLVLAYHFYGRYLEKLWGIDSSRKTPALTKTDGVDYVPAKHWTILFGHHFASIAGAGPILGPVLAAVMWGWLPALCWIVLGSIFLGGVHDFSALILSVRQSGNSMGEVTDKVLGHRSKTLFSLFLWLALILVVAVFAAITAKTFLEEPRIVIPTFGLVGIAFLFGLLVHRLHFSQVSATLISLLLLVITFIVGYKWPVHIPGSNALSIWIGILILYAFLASVLPVHLLLQPRDYLASYLLFAGLFFGYLGLIISRPAVQTPTYISFSSSQGPLLPMMFVIIACGAISGFHSLVSSGTSSKQIASELDTKRIGYGAMLTEGAVAILALLTVVAGLTWNAPNSALNYPELMRSGNVIGTFARGFGQITGPVWGTTAGVLVATVMINGFVLTTLDTATRIARYVSQELFGQDWQVQIMRHRYGATGVIVVLAGALALGNWQKIWPVFGASNQLISALVLLVAGCFLLSRGKNSRIVLIPAAFMFVTTVWALVLQARLFYSKKGLLLGNTSVVLIVLSLFVLWEALKKIQQVKRKDYYEKI